MPLALASTVIGEGPPAVILHGLFGSGTNWRTIARGLASRLECHLVDQRNHGRSPHARGMAYPDLAEDVLGYLDRLDRKFHHHPRALASRSSEISGFDTARLDRVGLIGHSMGGKAAMTLALLAPERVGWLVVADIAPAPSPSDHRPILDALRGLAPASLATRAAADAALARSIPEPALRQFLLRNLVHGDGDGGLRWRIDLDAIAEALPDLLGFPSLTPGAAYPGPTLFLRGEHSEYLTASHEARIRTLFPCASIDTIPGAGHWLHAEQPAAVTDRIARFIDESTAG
ncbi:MAG: alpha/beta fold hydrolase [Thiotrichales bacterium]|nr:alpha/beta fold hydrolase [Thiotrichales bacterium]